MASAPGPWLESGFLALCPSLLPVEDAARYLGHSQGHRRAEDARRVAVEYSSMKQIPYHLNPRFELDTGAAPALLCHCEHCGVVRVPRFQVRAWLSEADVISLPGLDGWPVITKRAA